MARRDERVSDPKRHRSRFDQQPSPKRSRRDGKVENERPPLEEEEKKHRHHNGDSLHLQKSIKQDFKAESEKRNNGRNEGAKKVEDSAQVPRSHSRSQHDDRDNSWQGGRSFSRREPTDRGWWKDSREQEGARSSRTAAPDTRRKENKVKAQGVDDDAWRHDKFSELQSETDPPARKRPAFREQKIAAESLQTERTAADPQKPTRSERPASEREKQNGREGHNYRSWDRRERPLTGERGDANRKDIWRGNFPSTDRYGNGNRRDRFAAGQGTRLGGGYSEKWKHDLFDEANRSPPRKSEEDQIAKVEALLAP